MSLTRATRTPAASLADSKLSLQTGQPIPLDISTRNLMETPGYMRSA
jgi:hypothetical protein